MSQVNPDTREVGLFCEMIDISNQSGHSGIVPAIKKAMIYVVDDDLAVLKSLRFLLETEGFEVRTFRSGSALLESSIRYSADCLVVDYKMAGIDGLELTKRLRGLGFDAPIILITGHPDASILTKAHSAGVYQVVLKPDLQDNLVEHVRNAIDSMPPPRESGKSPP